MITKLWYLFNKSYFWGSEITQLELNFLPPVYKIPKWFTLCTYSCNFMSELIHGSFKFNLFLWVSNNFPRISYYYDYNEIICCISVQIFYEKNVLLTGNREKKECEKTQQFENTRFQWRGKKKLKYEDELNSLSILKRRLKERVRDI